MDIDLAPPSHPDVQRTKEIFQSTKHTLLSTALVNVPTQPASMRFQRAQPAGYLTLQNPQNTNEAAAANAMIVDPVHEALSKHQTVVPVNDIIGIQTHSQWVIISNISGMRVWGDVVRLTRDLLRGNKMGGLQTIVRTDEHKDGATTQVFWFAFNTPTQAAQFRGLIASRKLVDGPYFRCDFVSGNDFSRACGESTDRWSAKGGYFEGLDENSPFSQPPLRSRRKGDRPRKFRKLLPPSQNPKPITSETENRTYSNIPASSASSSLLRPPGLPRNSFSSLHTSATTSTTSGQSASSSRDMHRATPPPTQTSSLSFQPSAPTASLLSRISGAPSSSSEFALTLADRLSEPVNPPALPSCYPKPHQNHRGYRRRQ